MKKSSPLLQIVNSVVMNHVVIEDGCHIQGSVVCNNVQLQERSVLKDCQVASFGLCSKNEREHFKMHVRLKMVAISSIVP